MPCCVHHILEDCCFFKLLNNDFLTAEHYVVSHGKVIVNELGKAWGLTIQTTYTGRISNDLLFVRCMHRLLHDAGLQTQSECVDPDVDEDPVLSSSLSFIPDPS